MDIWAIYSALSKFGLYLGALGAAGLAFNAVIFKAYIDAKPLRGWITAFALLGLLSAAANYALRGASLMGEWSGAFDPEILGILWETPVGTALLWRVIGFALVFASVFAGMWLACVGGTAVLWSFTQIGHVSDVDMWVLQPVLLVHLMVATFWVGILIPLRRLVAQNDNIQTAADLGHAFGQIATFAIPTLIVTGLILTYFLLGGVGGFISQYGVVLVAKIVFVTALLGLGAINKLRFVPQLRTGDARAARHLARSISFEWIVILMIFAVTAALTTAFTPTG